MRLAQQLKTAAHVVRYFVTTRAVEVCALQASPVIGVALGGYRPARDGVVPLLLLLAGSGLLTAHIFVYNDWAGSDGDRRDPLRAPHAFGAHGIARRDVALFAGVLLVLAAITLALVGTTALWYGAAIAALGFLYSSSPLLGKHTPVASSLNHLVGGTLHFLLGYTLAHPFDATGVWIGLFFGLVFAAGHLNQELRDYAGDRLLGIRTNAVVFGPRRAFAASVFTFTAAYAMLTALSAAGLLPKLLLWSPVAWLLHLAWARQALRRGLSSDTAVWMQRRYRWLFALIGLVMLGCAFPQW